jgi:hypothetical protein
MSNMRVIFLFGFLLLASINIQAQADEGQSNDEQSKKYPSIHQFFIEQEIRSVEKVIYKDTEEEIKWEISEDKGTVTMFNYEPRKRVIVIARDKNGKETRFERSPCVIFETLLM